MKILRKTILLLICLILISQTALAEPIACFKAIQLKSNPLSVHFVDLSTEKPNSWYSYIGYVAKPDYISTSQNSFFVERRPDKPTSWYWCFGDAQKPDSISTSQNPFFTYSRPGHYQVHLRVWDHQHHMSWITQRITVSDDKTISDTKLK